MNKTINIFKHYSLKEIEKSVIVVLLFIGVPFALIITLTINITLLMVPDLYIVITIMVMFLIGFNLFGWKVFIETLRHYQDKLEVDYRLLYFVLCITSTTMIIITSYLVPYNIY